MMRASLSLELLAVQPSLFEPSSASSLQSAAEWIEGLLQGPMVVTLCVIAVALVGFAALSGRLPVRMGARAVLGCFIVLGAPAIASALMWQGEEPSPVVVCLAEIVAGEPARPECRLRAMILIRGLPFGGSEIAFYRTLNEEGLINSEACSCHHIG